MITAFKYDPSFLNWNHLVKLSLAVSPDGNRYGFDYDTVSIYEVFLLKCYLESRSVCHQYRLYYIAEYNQRRYDIVLTFFELVRPKSRIEVLR